MYYIQFPAIQIVVDRMNNSGYMRQYQDFLLDLKNNHPEAVIEYDIPVWDIQWFAVDSHLNEAGAELFSQVIKSKYFFEER